MAVCLLTAAALRGESYAVRPIASGLYLPVAITHAGDARLFITLQPGKVVIHDGLRILPRPFLEIGNAVYCGVAPGCGPRGLLSIAFHPQYRENGRFYVFYVDRLGDIVIASYRASSDPDRADHTSGRILLTIQHRTLENIGGQLQFGPDGYLYAGIGDAGGTQDSSQDLRSHFGKILRLDVDDPNGYLNLPTSNPFYSRSHLGDGFIWAYGLRNPWRFSFDRESGDLWIADVGQDEREEINRQRASSAGGENYGWPFMEGNRCFGTRTNCNFERLTRPILDYDHNVGCAVIGGYRYRGADNPSLRGAYLYADYCSGDISAATEQADGRWISRRILSTDLQISSFGEDVNGEIYIADHRGGIFRLMEAEGSTNSRRRAVRR